MPPSSSEAQPSKSSAIPPPVAPAVSPPATSTRRSFLPKLPVRLAALPRPPHPRRFIPFRSSREKALSPLDPSQPPLATLVVRVLAGRDLVAKDRNGLSDPFLVMRYADKRVTSPTVQKSLNPVWGPGGEGVEGGGGEAKLEAEVWEGRVGPAVEIVVWDRDRVGKQYLGEVNLRIEDWWGEPSSWKDGVPPVGAHDADNKPIWHEIKSSRSRANVSGALLIQVGFVASPSTPNSPSKELTPTQRSAILAALQRLKDETEGSRRASKEERVLLAAPTEGVGTQPISEHTPLGLSPNPQDAVDDSSSSSGSESDGEESDEESTSSEDEGDSLPPILGSPSLPVSVAPPPITEPTLPVLDVPTLPEPSLRPSTARKGLSIPFFKRTGSGKSIPTASILKATESESASESGDGGGKKGRKRFGRKRVVLEGVKGEGEKEEGKKVKKIKRRKSKRRKGRGAGYRYEEDADDVLGLVQIEIKGAKDLPKYKNMLKTGWDMDAFLVVSFGRKVFRTRVIRHSLNPVWDERLFFHVRHNEIGWDIAFNLFDWDKMSSNDHVGDVSVPLSGLIGEELHPDERGLYPCSKEGKLLGDEFSEHDLGVQVVDKEGVVVGGPTLQIRAKFTPYDALRQQFWRCYLRQYDIDESGAFSHLEIFSMLDSLGSTLSKETISSFFTRFGKTDEQELDADEVVICLEQELRKPLDEKRQTTLDSGLSTPALGAGALGFAGLQTNEPEEVEVLAPSGAQEIVPPGTEVVTNVERGTVVKAPGRPPSRSSSSSGAATELAVEESSGSNDSVEHVINVKECPLCHRSRLHSNADMDIVTHLAICSSNDPRSSVNRIVVGGFVTASQAQRKFFTKIISKVTKGSYRLGADSANIIVQDRKSGVLIEEKIPVYVRLGIRLAYRGMGAGGGMEGARIRRMLESMSYKQGAKFDSPNSVREIQPFIDFHKLNMDEVLDPVSSFKTFNEFFYRKLKPEARPVADLDNPRTLVSPADCRAMFFETIDQAQEIWIKGREFTLERLLGDAFKDKVALYEGGSLAIFRLSPQDYHRFHVPVDGVCGPQKRIPGAYYTVNPMAVRSAIDIYGENVRTLGTIDSPVFGEVMNVWVGAMLVATTVLTKKEGEEVKRGDEIGYFAFGGSTILTLYPKGKVVFDQDLLENSSQSLETLVQMGSRIGRAA